VSEEGRTYDAAGVSLATAEAVVERLRAAVESTGATNFGAFAALHPLGDGRFLAASTDSVGTKLILARRRGALRACGADLAAHCINDVITCGAEPLILLDYVAAAHVELEEVAELVEGAAEVCRAAGVALVGGETAELPGIYREGELDFAGTCVGVVEEPLDGSAVEAGDVVVGFPSAGVHANGFTLARRVLEAEDYDGDDLLAPTRLTDAAPRLVTTTVSPLATIPAASGNPGSVLRCRPACVSITSTQFADVCATKTCPVWPEKAPWSKSVGGVTGSGIKRPGVSTAVLLQSTYRLGGQLFWWLHGAKLE